MAATLRTFFMLCLSLWLAGLCGAATPPVADSGQANLVAQGRLIYTEGQLSSGQPLQASRAGGGTLSGHEAACTGCHRASGMGSVEGTVRVSPISERYLFAREDDLVMANMDGRRGKTMSQLHAPYTDAALATALRDGLSITGRTLSEVMPHFNLGAHDMAALTAYLHQLSAQYSPGVSKEVIRFATVITPEVSPARREVFKAMLQSALVAKNSSTSPRKRYMTSAATFATQTERRWDVQVWELNGAPETWAAQMNARYAAAPVFALLSGISDSTWAPVDAFCQAQQLPCWFPSAAVPTAGAAPYGLYFSRGVALEAEVLARYLRDADKTTTPHATGRLFQVSSPDAAAVSAAQTFEQSQQVLGRSAHNTVLDTDAIQARAALRALLQATRAGDAVALWLDAAQLAWLEGLTPPDNVQFFISASLAHGGSGSRIPANWRSVVQMVYPYALPQERQANLAYLHSWLKLRNIPLVDEVLQSELFFSLNLMTDTLQDMLDNLYRDYLIERTEDMLGRREAGKVEQENRDRQTLGRAARASVATEAVKGNVVSEAPDAQTAQQRAFGLGESGGTTVYPHLSLGPTQRFASRGAYIVRFAAGNIDTLAAQSEWIVP
jgi:cytochrome c553